MGFVVPISVRPGCCSGSMAGARPRQRRALPGEGRRLCDQVRIRGDAIKSLHTFWLWRFIGPATAAPGLVCARTALTALAPGLIAAVGGAAVVLLPRRVCERDAPQNRWLFDATQSTKYFEAFHAASRPCYSTV